MFQALPARTANSSAEAPTLTCKVSGVQPAVAEHDFLGPEFSGVEKLVFGLAREPELALRVGDRSDRGRGKACATNDQPAGRVVTDRMRVENPYPGGRIGVEGDVRSAACGPDRPGETILEVGPILYEAGTASGILPGVFHQEVSGERVARESGASHRHDVG